VPVAGLKVRLSVAVNGKLNSQDYLEARFMWRAKGAKAAMPTAHSANSKEELGLPAKVECIWKP
jgi:hypothetical protein